MLARTVGTNHHQHLRIVVPTSTAAQNRSWPGRHDPRRRIEFLGKKSNNIIYTYGGFLNWGYSKMDGLQGNIPLKLMIWGYPYFRKLPSRYTCNVYIYIYPTYMVGRKIRCFIFEKYYGFQLCILTICKH